MCEIRSLAGRACTASLYLRFFCSGGKGNLLGVGECRNGGKLLKVIDGEWNKELCCMLENCFCAIAKGTFS